MRYLGAVLSLCVALCAFSAKAEPVSATDYVSGLKSELAAALLGDKGPDGVARFVREQAFDLQALNQLVLSETGGVPLPIEIQAPKKIIDYANLRLKRSGLTSFVYQESQSQGPTWVTDADLVATDARYQKWMKIRKWTIPTVALFAGIAGGIMNHQLASGIAIGVTSFGLEYQFAHFNGWWNRNVWTRFGFAGSVAVNLLYPVVNKMAELGTRVAQSTIQKMNQGQSLETAFAQAQDLVLGSMSWSEFATGTAIGAATFVASFGAVQIALAKLKENGQISETSRFVKDTVLGLIGNAGRVLGMVAGSVSGQNSNASEISPSQWIGWLIQLGIFTSQGVPLWSKLLGGDAAYDAYTFYLSEVKAGRGDQHPWSASPLRKFCGQFLSRISGKSVISTHEI